MDEWMNGKLSEVVRLLLCTSYSFKKFIVVCWFTLAW